MYLAPNHGVVDWYYCECLKAPSIKEPAIDDFHLSQAVTAYSPVLLKAAGYSAIKENGLAGGLNTIGIVGTIISAQIVDKLGRRVCLMGGAAGLFAVNLVVCILPWLDRM